MDHDEADHDMPDELPEEGATIDLVEVDPAGGPTGWRQGVRRHRRALQALVAALVLLGAFAASAAVTTPEVDDDALETGDPERGRASRDRSDPRDGATPSSEGDARDGGDDEGTGTGGGRGRGGRRAERKADRQRDQDEDDRSDRGGRDQRPPTGGGGGPTPPGPAPTLTIEVGPASLAPFGKVTVSPRAPCPAGSAVARVEVTAVGGSVAGSVVAIREAPVAGDGSWSLAPFSVPVVGGIDGVDWAATADQLVVGASCVGGSAPRYVSVTVGLDEAAVVPVLEATLTAGTVDAELEGCPTAAVLHLVAAESPPPPGEAFEPTTSVVMERAGPGAPWSAQADAPAAEPGQGLWAAAGCLDAPDGATVWRSAPVVLVAP